MTAPLLVYGAYGYTGALVARRAVERGLPTVLAGRDSERLAQLARELGCRWRAFPLTDPDALREGIAGCGAVLHCAGPFIRTYRAMVEACLDSRVHYLDVTGELPVLEGIAALGPAAERVGVMLLPGAGFDVVPSDCLAAHLVRRLPSAKAITLAFQALGRISRGTARTVLLQAGSRPAGGAAAVRTFDLGSGPVQAVSIPWGDLATAPRSTGVRDVAVYVAAPGARGAVLRAMPAVAPVLAPLLAIPQVADAGAWLLSGGQAGPDAAQRARGSSRLYGEAVDGRGGKVVARLRAPDAYALTADAATEIASRVLAGEVRPGWQTPASAYGPDLVLALAGTERVDA